MVIVDPKQTDELFPAETVIAEHQKGHANKPKVRPIKNREMRFKFIFFAGITKITILQVILFGVIRQIKNWSDFAKIISNY